MSPSREQLAHQIIEAGRFLYGRGWSPATSSNYSARLSASEALLTVSGKHKGELGPDDVLATDMQGRSLEAGKKPSAETLLHTQLYRRHDAVGAVLHTHSHASTVLTMHWPANSITLEGYELLKALEGFTTHDSRLVIPVFDNTQDIAALADQVDAAMADGDISHAYLIRGHGLYTWASDLPTCYRQLEALETLLAIELDRRRLQGV